MWLLLINMSSVRFSHVKPFLFHYINRPQFVSSLIDGYLGDFRVLTVMNKAAMNIFGQGNFWLYVLISPVYVPRGGIAGPSECVLHFMRNCQLSKEVVLICLFLVM